MRALENEPVAQAVITKLIIQQQSAALYVAQNTPPNAKYGSGTPAPQIIYAAGKINYAKVGDIEGLGSYLPYGFNYDSAITSEIYCLKKANLAAAATNCSDTDAVRYLISYMQIPQRWLNVKTKRPNNDFINAIKTTVGLDTTIGYVGCTDSTCAQYGIIGVQGMTHNYLDSGGNAKSIINMQIPAYIVANGGFKTTCITPGKVCLAQMFTYASEIYY